VPAEKETDLDTGEFARELVDVITDKKGSDVMLLDVQSVSLLADYFVICSADTERQLKAIVDDIQEKGKAAGFRALQVEGSMGSGWMVLDYGALIVHVLLPAQRDYYDLEELWSDAALVVRIQ
jgi:ribosome-associated protein